MSLRRFAIGVLAAASVGGPAVAGTPLDEPPRAPRLEFDGRLHLQHDSFDGLYSEGGLRRTATFVRRARLAVSSRLPLDLRATAEAEFEPGGRAVLRTAVLAWRAPPAGTLRAGRFDPDFGLEQATSSNWTTGIERSAVWDLGADIGDIGRGHGLQFDAAGSRLYGSLGAFEKPGDARGWVGRAAFAPLRTRERVVHLGLSLASQRLDDEDGRIRTRLAVRGVTENDGGNRVTLAPALDAEGRYGRHRLAALEFAAVAGPYSLQAEALQRRLSGGAAPSRTARGHYVQLAWTLTGEARPYDIDGAKFERIAAANPRRGAWEVYARHDRLAVSVPGDRRSARARVLGVNWYADERLRLSANAIRGRAEGGAAGRAFGLRLQLVF